MQDRIRIRTVDVLYKGWSTLKRNIFDYRRSDGNWETQTRETYERGHGAAVLPYDPARQTVLLVRQFRLPAYVDGHMEPLIEACAGLLDDDDPEAAIRREAIEELGYRIHDLRLAFDPFMSPGSVVERIACFTATYAPEDRVNEGGGHVEEGEDIEILEMPLDDALVAVADGRIIDAKTIMLVQHLMLTRSV